MTAPRVLIASERMIDGLMYKLEEGKIEVERNGRGALDGCMKGVSN